ncbi:MAG: MATE family efflux transporter [Phenylobacterium sp.]|uniref:MATE family efflux transporter n=1 Tax=Phenylobacterium sp. TaxID=1871053 RepID=UPI002735DEBC|nr:MATE family efflux transporter [Phenylobacterium sp.]MDP3174749.1 MATE family efflux transporter [Phenylobacterium sp.]
MTTAPRPVPALVSSPLLPTLLRLAAPAAFSQVASAAVSVAETVYIGRLGTVPLAAVAVVFPFVILVGMLSGGAMGGGVSSAISRALGAGDRERAGRLVVHAALIGLAGGVIYTMAMIGFGPAAFAFLGARGAVLEQATAYSHLLFAGAISIWMANILASTLRGSGDLKTASMVLMLVSVAQILIGGVLGLGLGPAPRLGMPGVAAGSLIAYSAGALYLLWRVLGPRARLPVRLAGFRPNRALFADILKVGGVACLSSVQSVATILVFTRIVGHFGPEALAGYGVGARLEFLLTPLSFAIGVAAIPMVGMAIRAGDIARARRVAWAAGGLAGGLAGIIGTVIALKPSLWTHLFTSDPGVRAAAAVYLHWAGPAFVFLGLAMALYFAAQGAARIVGPVLAQTARLVAVLGGGLWLAHTQAPVWQLFALVAFSLAVYGLSMAGVIYFTRWGPKPARP